MANKVTQEEIELINELYCELKVKARVAEAVGRSVSTVSKYIIPDYVPKADRVKIVFEGEPIGCEEMIKNFSIGIFSLSEEERADLETLKKEIF